VSKKESGKLASVSKLERRTDMYISTLRSVIEAMGGRLEITAVFRDGDFRISLFEDLDEPAPIPEERGMST